MAMKYLGDTLDIHCGAIDLIPVHHTNEIAQSEAATGKRFVNYWLHGEFLLLDKEKMAKSTGNFVRLVTITERGIPAMAYRFFLLSAVYRAPLSFNWEILENAKSGYQSLISKIQELRNNNNKPGSDDAGKFKEEFRKEISDDLNMPRAVAVMWDVLRDEALSNRCKLAAVEDFDRVFGLGLKDIAGSFVEVGEGDVQELIRARDKARADKDWKKSDEFRDALVKKGYRVIDTKQGTKAEKV